MEEVKKKKKTREEVIEHTAKKEIKKISNMYAKELIKYAKTIKKENFHNEVYNSFSNFLTLSSTLPMSELKQDCKDIVYDTIQEQFADDLEDLFNDMEDI